MSEYSYFFDSVGVDRVYNTDQEVDWLYQHINRKDGVLQQLDSALALTVGSYQAIVAAGVAALNGRIYVNTASLTLGLAAVTSSYKRIDVIVIRFDKTTNRLANAMVIQGTQTTGTPSAPSTTSADVLVGQVLIDNTTGSPTFTPTDQRNMRQSALDFLPDNDANLAANSATRFATQQAVKAYIDRGLTVVVGSGLTGDSLATIVTAARSGLWTFATGATNTPEGTATGTWFYSYEGTAVFGFLTAVKQGTLDVYCNVRAGSAWGGFFRQDTPPIETVIRIGPGDATPASLYPNTTWTDVSYEEEGCVLRVGTSVIGKSLTQGGKVRPGTFTVTVASGVPTVAFVYGGDAGFYPASTTIPLTLVGACTTQWTGTATTNASGQITAVTQTIAGVGYLSGGSASGGAGANFVLSGSQAVIVYDGYSRVADSFMGHYHSGAPFPQTGMTQNGSAAPYSWSGGTTNTTGPVTDGAVGTPRTSAETTGAYAPAKKYRRTA